jgi:diguanylate cyclase (GGDEF)-like protein
MQEPKCSPCQDNCKDNCKEAPPPRKPLTLKRRLRRAVSPENLSLKARFLFVPGFLLAIGSVTLFIVFVYYQGLIISESVNSRLGVFEQWVQDKINAQLDLLTSEVVPVSSMPEVAESLRERDRERLKAFILPYMERLRALTGQDSFYYHFHLPPATSFLRTWALEDTGADLSDIRLMVVKTNKYFAPFRGAEVGQGGAVLRAIVPISHRGEHLGSVEAASSIESLLQLSQLPSQFGVVLLLERRFADIVLPNHPLAPHGNWLVGRTRHVADETALYGALDSGRIPQRIGNTFFRFLTLDDFQGQPIGGLLLSYDSSTLAKSTVNEAVIFSLAFNMGAMTLMFMLYLNVKRVKQFLSRLRRILVETNNGNFGERFETEPVHCLDVLRCHKRECPVYENPSLICYMETGDRAISPAQRNTCAFLKQYRNCEACPVHALRHGDELVEMRNAVNTMMRIWGVFATRVNQVVAGVLHSRESAEHTPSLTHISATLEHMAGLTAFTHDLQGVISKAEVFAMLDNVFTRDFGLSRYAILEIDQADRQMNVAADKLGDPAVLCAEVFGSPDMCRAKRMAEEVSSASNKALCPYFHIDHATLTRCCLPLVMGGRVGGVISFVFPRGEWEKRRVSMSIIQKYLSESAPVLSTMQLLQISKENANRDALTGAHNRRFLDEYVGKYEAVAVRDGRMVGFIMADMDHFKHINDSFGHMAGDAVLKDLSALISHQIRKADLVVRYGGEEFLVLLHEVRTGYTAEVAEKIRHSVETHVFELPDGRTARKTISLGVSEFPADADMFHKAIKCADMALYRAKAAGRNRVEKYEPHMWKETAQ